MASMSLLVDASAKPVRMVPLKDAVQRVTRNLAGRANGWQALVVDETRRFRSEHLDLPAPLVVMSPAYHELSEMESSYVSRRVLLARDKYQCQYCGTIAQSTSACRELTIDHVKPARLFSSRKAATTWDNVVAACLGCNGKKGGKLPREAGMYPGMFSGRPYVPKKPHFVQLRFHGRLHPLQRDYVEAYFRLHPGSTRSPGQP